MDEGEGILCHVNTLPAHLSLRVCSERRSWWTSRSTASQEQTLGQRWSTNMWDGPSRAHFLSVRPLASQRNFMDARSDERKVPPLGAITRHFSPKHWVFLGGDSTNRRGPQGPNVGERRVMSNDSERRRWNTAVGDPGRQDVAQDPGTPQL